VVKCQLPAVVPEGHIVPTVPIKICYRHTRPEKSARVIRVQRNPLGNIHELCVQATARNAEEPCPENEAQECHELPIRVGFTSCIPEDKWFSFKAKTKGRAFARPFPYKVPKA
jgi:hypothetical protein